MTGSRRSHRALAACRGKEAIHSRKSTVPELEQAWCSSAQPSFTRPSPFPTFPYWQDRLMKSFVDFGGSIKSLALNG